MHLWLKLFVSTGSIFPLAYHFHFVFLSPPTEVCCLEIFLICFLADGFIFLNFRCGRTCSRPMEGFPCFSVFFGHLDVSLNPLLSTFFLALLYSDLVLFSCRTLILTRHRKTRSTSSLQFSNLPLCKPTIRRTTGCVKN